MSIACRLISDAERVDLEERSIAAGTYRHGLMEPGMMWLCPWLHDPADPRDNAERMRALADAGEKRCMLSIHYWRDWSTKRPPITVVCPNGRQWCPDQSSSNGTGWTVAGDPPLLVCSPSIVVPGYHGWLGCGGANAGWFSADVEGRGPNGSKDAS